MMTKIPIILKIDSVQLVGSIDLSLNPLYAIHKQRRNKFVIFCEQEDLHRGSGLFDEHKDAPSGEYVCAKIDGEQQTV